VETYRHGLNLGSVEELFERGAVGGALLLTAVRVRGDHAAVRVLLYLVAVGRDGEHNAIGGALFSRAIDEDLKGMGGRGQRGISERDCWDHGGRAVASYAVPIIREGRTRQSDSKRGRGIAGIMGDAL